MNRTTLDVAIIGPGVIGLAAAYDLARAGANVVVLERAYVSNSACEWEDVLIRSGRV